MDAIPNIISNIINNIIMGGVQPWTSTFHPLYIHNGIKNLGQKNSLNYFEMSWISMRYF